jgi:putative endonuclease
MTARRRWAQRWGRHAESLGACLLQMKGYRILARGYRVPVGEIDLIARRGGTLVFVEIKARAEYADAAAAIGLRQRARIARAASLFLAQNPRLAGLAMRYDAIFIAPWRLPRHLPDAWREARP